MLTVPVSILASGKATLLYFLPATPLVSDDFLKILLHYRAKKVKKERKRNSGSPKHTPGPSPPFRPALLAGTFPFE